MAASRELRSRSSAAAARGHHLLQISQPRDVSDRNDQGKVIAFTGRTLSTDEKAGPKYLNSPETPIYSKSRVLFNLDNAKEAIRKLDYAILVEGQMDCISVYAAGFHNVIASSGTAFTEMQAKLLGRFSKNIVVNFDPDTAGARATERTLGLLVEEEFNIRVLTLETGFDPDLFIRRKGKDAYGAALKNSQKYFDYLIDRARAQFPARNAESKVKAVNHLLPHIQRVPSRIVRDELAHGDFAEAGDRFGGAAAGIETRRHQSLGDAGQGSGGDADYRRRARADPGARFGDADAVWWSAQFGSRRYRRRIRSGAAGAIRAAIGASV